MSVNIFYNNTDFFSANNLATPKVSRSTEKIIFGESVGAKELINLSGTIHIENPPSNCDYFSELNSIRLALLNFFSDDFNEFRIEDGSDVILERDFSKVLGVSFPSNGYTKTLEYSIDIECYDELMHNEFFGISNPVDETSISLSEDDIYEIKKKVSCNGVNTQDSSLSGNNISSETSSMQNAIDFVSLRVGKENITLPVDDPDIKIHLISKSESIDRLKNFYSIDEIYRADKNDTNLNNGILRYVIQKDENISNFDSIVISGVLKFGKEASFDSVRDRFKEIDFYQKVVNSLSYNNLGKFPVNRSISELEDKNEISFSITFDNDDNYDDCGISKNISFNISEKAEVVDVSVSGKISARGPSEGKFDLVKDSFLNTAYNASSYSSWINELAQGEVNRLLTGIILRKEPIQKNESFNEQLGQISFEYVFTNRSGLDNFDLFECSVEFTLPIKNYSINMNYGGTMDKYLISETGEKKAIINIKIDGSHDNAINADAAMQEMRVKAASKFNEIESDFNLTSKFYSVTSNNEASSEGNNNISYSEVRHYYDEIR